MAEKHILISLDDERAKAVSEVLGNKTCKKILDYLSENDSSESDISKELKMPLNTVGYNIKKLVSSGLIESSNHWWSVKGKKIPIYKASNKRIIISPLKLKSEKLKQFLAPVLLSGFGALILRGLVKSEQVITESIDAVSGKELIQKASQWPGAIDNPDTFNYASDSSGLLIYISGLEPWVWFLIGAWFGLLLFFLLNLKRDKK